jgi:hypothetical protein
MIIPVADVGQVGIVGVDDMPPRRLPLNAWTNGKNIRFRDGAVEKFRGHSEVFATPLWAPIWLIPIASGGNYFWIYAGQTKVGATDGSTHADITRSAGGDYTFDSSIGWTGTIIEGKAVLNNGADVPQMWTPNLANDLTALTGWDANWRTGAMRVIKQYLVALDVTKSGVHNPYMIKWSHRAPEGGVPTSWDETDETLDAGEWDLPAEGGWVVDGIPLRDLLCVYKEYETWLMQYVGGIDVFKFTRAFSSFGMLTRRCAAEFFNGRHVVFTGDDVVLHDGQQSKSIADFKTRRLIASLIDPSTFERMFVTANFKAKEVSVCFPEVGSTWSNKALVWNWVQDTWGVRDLPDVAFMASGLVDPGDTGSIWSGASGTWDTDTVSWGERTYNPAQRDLLMALPSVTKLMLFDSTQQFAGANMTSYVEKTGIGFPLKINQPPDFTTRKLVKALWPRISGTQGGTVNVSVGAQELIGGPIAWGTAQPFVIGSTEFLDPLIEGRMHALKFESNSNIEWKLEGYDIDVSSTGMI